MDADRRFAELAAALSNELADRAPTPNERDALVVLTRHVLALEVRADMADEWRANVSRLLERLAARVFE